jgi:hypothetical protein
MDRGMSLVQIISELRSRAALCDNAIEALNGIHNLPTNFRGVGNTKLGRPKIARKAMTDGGEISPTEALRRKRLSRALKRAWRVKKSVS